MPKKCHTIIHASKLTVSKWTTAIIRLQIASLHFNWSTDDDDEVNDTAKDALLSLYRYAGKYVG